jgi:hypothetical protein
VVSITESLVLTGPRIGQRADILDHLFWKVGNKKERLQMITQYICYKELFTVKDK